MWHTRCALFRPKRKAYEIPERRRKRSSSSSSSSRRRRR
jgi:hypothetical protein